MANKINVLEVGPRDGWQNLKQMLTFEQKLELIGEMFDAGVQEMEVTSFVSPKAIPQMADASELAKACYVSESRLYHLFRAEMHKSPIEYKNEMKVLRSIEYLKNGYTSVEEISALLGFRSAAYFRRLFKKITGMTPSEYRRRHAAK